MHRLIANKRCWYVFLCGTIVIGIFVWIAGKQTGITIFEHNGARAATAKTLYWLTGFAIVFLHLIVFSSLYAIHFYSIQLERFALCIILMLGGLYVFLMTPFSAPDEIYHYCQSYRLSNTLIGKKQDVISDGWLDPSNYTEQVNTFQGYVNSVEEWNQNREQEDEKIPKLALYRYAPEYFFSAAGITLGRLLSAGAVRSYYLGRILNLLFYAFCSYFAVRRIPRFKLLFSMIVMLPMAIHQGASFSYDCFFNGLGFLTVASALSILFSEETLSVKELLWLIIPLALALPSKGGAGTIFLIAVIPLYFLIPKSRFSRGYYKLLYFILILLLSMIMLLLMWNTRDIASIPDTGYSVTKGDVRDVVGVSGALQHPLSTVMAVYKTFQSMSFLWVEQAIGLRLGGLSLWIPEWIIIILILLLILSTFNCSTDDATKECVLFKWRLIFFGIAVCYAVAVTLTEYITYSEPGSPTAAGTQGRYFLPVLPLLMMCANNRTIQVMKNIDKPILMFFTLLSARIILQIILFTLF